MTSSRNASPAYANLPGLEVWKAWERSFPFRAWKFAIILGGAIMTLGCCQPAMPQPADPDQARAALRVALDVWQKGGAAESLKDRQPALIVVDYEWRSGYRLVRYQLEKDEPLGADLRCHVKLSLQNNRGKSVQKTAIYSVGTSPALTVMREEDP